MAIDAAFKHYYLYAITQKLNCMKTKFTLLYFTLALCVATPIISRAQVNVQDSLALVDLYNSTDGRHWISSYQWLSLNPVSTWEGIAVKDSRVSSIGLLENNLNGNIPASIGSLEKLEYLNLAENTLIVDIDKISKF